MNDYENDASLSVLVDSRIYGYLFAPIITALGKINIKVYIYAPSKIIEEVKFDIGEQNFIVYCELDKLRQSNRNRWRIHRIAQDLFTRSDFSYQYYKRRKQLTKKLPISRRILASISILCPKVPNRYINRFLNFIAGIGLRNPFATELVLVGSLNSCAELLTAKKQRIITVMESWDHAVKEPNGYTSDLVFTWNSALKRDWQRVHADKNVEVFFPLKLRFAQKLKPPLHTISSAKRPFCVYAVAGTRRFSIDILIQLERKLIRDLAKITEAVGWDLFIKPRPNGEDGEFDDIIADFANVKVGSIAVTDIDQAANYSLSEDYNMRRFSEIEGASFIINAFTTFGLDAAAANIPVLQIDLQNALGYKKSKMIYNNYHIKNYLNSSQFVMRVEGDFSSVFAEFLRKPNNSVHRYAEEMRDWLFEGRSQDESITQLVMQIKSKLSK